MVREHFGQTHYALVQIGVDPAFAFAVRGVSESVLDLVGPLDDGGDQGVEVLRLDLGEEACSGVRRRAQQRRMMLICFYAHNR